MTELDLEEENKTALNSQHEIITIAQAVSGKGDYLCRGCGGQLIAKKGDFLIHHFSHDAKDVTRLANCTVYSESARHKAAKDILQILKKIKVPMLIKRPPAGITGPSLKIQDSYFIQASYVRNELTFYENEQGKLKWGNKSESEATSDKYFLVKPDVTFFNKDGEPILFIEFKASHSIEASKYLKLQRLGIDTIQVRLPKGSQEEIEKSLLTTAFTQWIYNKEQEQFDYESNNRGDRDTIYSFNEFEESVYRASESYECKQNQINNLIRKIGKYLDSEQYKEAEKGIRIDIERTQRNKERDSERLREIQGKLSTEVDSEFKDQEAEFRREQTEQLIAVGITKIRGDQLSGRRENLNSRREELRRRISKNKWDNYGEEGNGGDIKERIARAQSDKISITGEISELELQIKDVEEQISRIELEITALPEKFSELEAGVRDDIEKGKIRLRSEFEESTRSIIDAVKRRDSRGTAGIHGKIKDILEAGALISNTIGQARAIQRLRKAKDAITWGDHENWI